MSIQIICLILSRIIFLLLNYNSCFYVLCMSTYQIYDFENFFPSLWVIVSLSLWYPLKHNKAYSHTHIKKKKCIYIYMYMKLQRNIIQNSQNGNIPNILNPLNKQDIVHPDNGILFRIKKNI